jgi:hypothetical protein
MREFLRFVLMRCVAARVRRVRLKNCRNYCRVLDKILTIARSSLQQSSKVTCVSPAASTRSCVAQTQTTACFDAVKITTSKLAICGLVWFELSASTLSRLHSLQEKASCSYTILEVVQRPSFQHSLINSAPVQHSLIQKIAGCRD